MVGGRKRSSIWILYREIPGSLMPKRCKKAVCKYCGADMMCQVARMRKHTQSCMKTPLKLRSGNQCFDECTDANNGLQEDSGSSGQKSITKYLTKPLTKSQEYPLYESLVLALISENLPWNLLNNKHFKQVFHGLRPDFDLPSEELASGSVLRGLHSKVSIAIKEFVNNARALTIVNHTWTSESGQNFLSWIIANEFGSKKLLAVEPADPTKRKEDIVQDVAQKSKELREMKSNGKLMINFVSDSASVRVEARELLRQNLESGISLTGACLAQQSNLLVKDLMGIGRVWKVIEKVVVVASFIRRSVALRNSICQYMGLEKIPMWLPSESRWCSFSETLKHVINVRTAIQGVFVQEKLKPHLNTESACTVRAIINDEGFWEATKAIYSLLKPYYVITAISELDNTSAGLILSGWMWLKMEIEKTTALSADEKSLVLAKMQRTASNYIEDHHLVSWILDPRVRGCGLNTAGKRLVRELAMKLYLKLEPNCNEMSINSLIKQWIEYDGKEGIFYAEATIWVPYLVSRPALFWMDLADVSPELSRLASTVLSCVPHAASCERLWSCAASTATNNHNLQTPANFEVMLRVKDHFGDSGTNKADKAFRKINGLLAETTPEMITDAREHDTEDAGVMDASDLTQYVLSLLENFNDDCSDPLSPMRLNILSYADDDSMPAIIELMRHVAAP